MQGGWPLLDFMGQDDIAAINEARLVAYQEFRLAQDRSPATVNSEIGTLLYVLSCETQAIGGRCTVG